MLFGHRGEAWVENQLMKLRSEIWECKGAFEEAFASHFSSGLSSPRFYVLFHLVDNLQISRALTATNAALPEDFNVLLRQSYRVRSRRSSTSAEAWERGTWECCCSICIEQKQSARKVAGIACA